MTNSYSQSGDLLGMTVKDEISGVQGVVTAEIMYLYGCQRVEVSPVAKADEVKLPDVFWVDRARVKVLTEIPRVVAKIQQTTGFNTIPPSRTQKEI